MDIPKFIAAWIAVSNQYDTTKYLDYYLPDAILDDPSVGQKFIGHAGIREYFESYFIGYKTQTTLVALKPQKENNAHLEVRFSGNFPEGEIGGTFDFTFQDGKIKSVTANLI